MNETGTIGMAGTMPGASAVDVIDALLERAAKLKASDVHIDPRASDILVRYRIDGEVELAGSVPKRLHEEVIARLKILAGARTDVHSVPQDGRFKADLKEGPYNARVSFMPTYHGENAVIRLLSASLAGQCTFASLGFTPEHVALITKAMAASDGLILMTGPTGSGKTTTLRVCLGLKAEEPISVMTLEDPVEYEVPGVRHVHIRRSHGVSFASGLRSALRQDPDVIMVGEIRDEETAQTVIHTALTGHLVFSTLHTTSAIDAIPRLMDMGIEPYLLAATLRLVVGQRLVRRICAACDGTRSVGAEECAACRGTGYAGRCVIAEACEIDDGMRDKIVSGAPVSALRDHAALAGFKTMSQDAGEKVDWGVTSRTEALGALGA
ncbi:MAG: type II/IV secretion system protein [Patescibacteria group bacterium]|nr:type II/IV secretion system protein [Patescibacteria group bacterium]